MGTVHRFTLAHELYNETPGAAVPLYHRVQANPPTGVTVEIHHDTLYLQCDRPGPTKLVAMADTIAEIYRDYGLTLNDARIDRPEQWAADGPDGWGIEIVAQLLLMAKARADMLDVSTNDLIGFLEKLPQSSTIG